MGFFVSFLRARFEYTRVLRVFRDNTRYLVIVHARVRCVRRERRVVKDVLLVRCQGVKLNNRFLRVLAVVRRCQFSQDRF